MENTSNQVKKNGLIKFLFMSAIGIFIFFIPIQIGGKSQVPLVHIIDLIKNILGASLNYIVAAVTVFLTITYFISLIPTKNAFIKKHHKKDGPIIGTLYVLAALVSVMVAFGIGPQFILDFKIGGITMDIAGGILLVVMAAGFFVSFLMEFGALEFFGTLLEPIMRKLYKIPGRASVDALASFVSSPSVGVFITNKLYTSNKYTAKEAAAITTNFSVCSLGGFALLSTIGGIPELFSHIVLSSFIVTFIIAAIMIRIYPLSKKKDMFYDGRIQSEEERKRKKHDKNIFSRALENGINKASEAQYSEIWKNFSGATLFAQKITAYIIGLSTLLLVIATYTPLFTWLGKPIVPLLNLLQLPDASIIAPSTIVGIAALSLPATLIAGKGVATISAFFVVVLSTVQIIFFTESANAIMESEIPLNVGELVLIFFMRTLIAMPLIAIIAHILF